jgi:hypothetical protein
VNPEDLKALEDIKTHGCHVIHVLEEEQYPRFTYSIGIEQQTGQPELVVTGLKRELAHSIISNYNDRIRAGEAFVPGHFYDGFIQGFAATFKVVERRHYHEYFGWARWLYKGDDFHVLQLIYPSTSGVWPWDAGATADYTWFIPRLYAT